MYYQYFISIHNATGKKYFLKLNISAYIKLLFSWIYWCIWWLFIIALIHEDSSFEDFRSIHKNKISRNVLIFKIFKERLNLVVKSSKKIKERLNLVVVQEDVDDLERQHLADLLLDHGQLLKTILINNKSKIIENNKSKMQSYSKQ